MEIEEAMAVALSKGSRVESGLHKAELVPERRLGEFFMKLIIALVFLSTLPAFTVRSRVIEDINGDGRIDAADFLESASTPSFPADKKESPKNA